MISGDKFLAWTFVVKPVALHFTIFVIFHVYLISKLSLQVVQAAIFWLLLKLNINAIFTTFKTFLLQSHRIVIITYKTLSSLELFLNLENKTKI